MHHAFAGQPIAIFGDGKQTRDFIYVKDIVAALSFAAETPGVHGTYNVGYGGSVTVNELARLIVEMAGSKSPVLHLDERPGDVRHSCASVQNSAAGFRHASTLEEGIRETLGFFRPKD